MTRNSPEEYHAQEWRKTFLQTKLPKGACRGELCGNGSPERNPRFGGQEDGFGGRVKKSCRWHDFSGTGNPSPTIFLEESTKSLPLGSRGGG